MEGSSKIHKITWFCRPDDSNWAVNNKDIEGQYKKFLHTPQVSRQWAHILVAIDGKQSCFEVVCFFLQNRTFSYMESVKIFIP